MTIQNVHVPGQADLPSPNPTTSFWLTAPSSILHQHRTTPNLPPSSDVIIIGSGIAGAFAAHHLSELSPNLSITMLEAREACSGATGRNGGHCQPKYYAKPVHHAQFELENLRYLKRFVRCNGVECEWRNVVGVHAYMTDEMYRDAVAGVDKLQDESPLLAGIVSYSSEREVLDGLRLNRNVVGAVMEHEAASLWPYKLVSWILERLLSTRQVKGAGSFNLQTNTPVFDLQQMDDESWVVHTPRGMLAAKHVIVCTNGYTSRLLPAFAKLIVPVRGQMSALTAPPAIGKHTALAENYSYAFLGNGSHTEQKDEYLIQRPFGQHGKIGGELMFGGARRYAAGGGVGVSDDSSIDGEPETFLRNALNDVLDLEDTAELETQSNTVERNSQGKKSEKVKEPLTAEYEWSGIMGFSRDGAPWVGPISKDLGGGEGLWICAGFTGHGMPNAALCARSVAEQVTGSVKAPAKVPLEYQISKSRAQEALKRPEITFVKINGAAGLLEIH